MLVQWHLADVMSHTLGSESGLLFSCCVISCLECCILDSAAIDSALFCIANNLKAQNIEMSSTGLERNPF